MEVLKRDAWRCQVCRKPGFEVDHILPMYKNPQVCPYDTTNLRVICKNCHLRKNESDSLTPGQVAWKNLVREML